MSGPHVDVHPLACALVHTRNETVHSVLDGKPGPQRLRREEVLRETASAQMPCVTLSGKYSIALSFSGAKGVRASRHQACRRKVTRSDCEGTGGPICRRSADDPAGWVHRESLACNFDMDVARLCEAAWSWASSPTILLLAPCFTSAFVLQLAVPC